VQRNQPISLTLYTRAGCCLCETAYDVVCDVRRALDSSVPTTLELVDITTDAVVLARYRNDIPVLHIEGRRAFQHRVDPERLRQRLVDGLPAPLEQLLAESA
jgi:hypothetical protein